MEPLQISNLFNALREGEIRNLEWVGQDLQFQVQLPAIAGLRGEGFTFFPCLLSGVTQFKLQPFRNDSTTLVDLRQINKLELKIEKAEIAEGRSLRVNCLPKAGFAGSRLHIVAESMAVWDEAFDALDAADLSLLRAKVAGK